MSCEHLVHFPSSGHSKIKKEVNQTNLDYAKKLFAEGRSFNSIFVSLMLYGMCDFEAYNYILMAEHNKSFGLISIPGA